MNENWTKWKSQ